MEKLCVPNKVSIREYIWCTHAHIKSGSFISHPTITRLFLFQHSHTPCEPDMLSGVRGRVETKKNELSLDER
jgi:hypothetical protein